MHTGRYIFSQIIDFLPERDFRRIVSLYRGDYKSSRWSCWDHLLALAFAQLTFRESLREIEDSLRPRSHHLYHLGFRGSIARSTLADANAARDWRIYRVRPSRPEGPARDGSVRYLRLVELRRIASDVRSKFAQIAQVLGLRGRGEAAQFKKVGELNQRITIGRRRLRLTSLGGGFM